jgi:Na+-transporting methylmalonyl-CoA/oxaloacetate decarboxylase gamma subunit
LAVADESAGETGGSAASGAGLPDTNRKITFSASYIIETRKYDEDYANIDRLVREAGGYIAGEETVARPYESEGTTGRSSYFSLKIPVEGYDSFLGKLEKVGEPSSKSKSSEDLTSEYFDTESRLEILKVRRDRLTGYIKNASKPADIVAFEKDLSDVLIEIDQYEGNKRRLDQLVDYAAVDVTLSEMITPETIGKDGKPLGDRASDAFQLSVKGVGEFLQNAAVFFAGAAPVIALIVVIIVVIWLIVKYARRTRARYIAAHPEKIKKKIQQNYAPYAQPAPYVQPTPTPQEQPAPNAPPAGTESTNNSAPGKDNKEEK